MRNLVLICLVLIVLVLAVYLPVGDHEFVNYDDETYVVRNAHVTNGITGQNIVWAFTSVEAANWHPVTWLSHMADVQIYGLNPRGHHLTSVIIHTISTLLLLFLLLRLTGALWPSAFVAALFALHPQHVESVAWVAERKDVLSAFFWFLTLLIYTEFAAKRTTRLYLLALFTFMLGLMSKPMLVTLPLVMLLLDFWPLQRLGGGEPGGVPALVKEKLPFFVCSLFSSIITLYAQHMSGAVADIDTIPLTRRIENALIAYVRYIGKALWPDDLAMLYPLQASFPLWQVLGSLLVLSLVTAATIRAGRKYPYLVVGWLWFLVTLLPVIGIIQVGSQAMADRYSYIPQIGLFVMVAWGVRDRTEKLPHRECILALLAGVVIISAAAAARQQLSYWQDSATLYRHTLQVTSGNHIIHDNLGLTLARKGDLDGAMQEYRKALLIHPLYKQAHANLGLALFTKGELDAAIWEYHAALRISPDYKEVHNNLGLALAGKGELNAAITEYYEALRISPEYVEAHNNLGIALARTGDLDAAIEEFQVVLRISPNDKEARINLEHALALKRTPR